MYLIDMEKLVSVIIPFYNGVKWLEEAVQSVLDQTYKNFEIIVINDGSPEDVTDFLAKYGDKIKYYYKENGGSATARNLGLKEAKGEYIALLDSDDIWLPDKTQLQVAFMEKSGAMWSHTGFYFWYPETGKLKRPNIKYNYGDISKRGGINFKISTPSVIFNAQMFRSHPEFHFPEHLRRGQDAGLYKQISPIYPLGLLNRPLMKVRMRGSNTNTQALIKIEYKNNVRKEVLENKDGKYDDYDSFLMFLLNIYHFNGKVVGWLKRSFNLKRESLEFIAKVLWVFPFFLERIYSKILIHRQHKGNQYAYLYEE